MLPCLLPLGACVLAIGLHAQQPATPAAASAQRETGKKLFVQRCSLCHLPSLGPGNPRPYARSLAGYVKGADAEARARTIVQKGVAPARMPGFQYTLDPNEVDSIVAYLSTLK
jgi:mono/diheme cytochrome c family protein